MCHIVEGMCARTGGGRIGRVQLRAEAEAEAEDTIEPSADELASGLVDVAGAPLGTLAGLEDSLLDELVERLLPAWSGLQSRLWNQGGECSNSSDGTRI
jgi:hypothetical protein